MIPLLNRKVVIWGCLPFYDTYSYIHYGFYKALSHMGYEVEWLDDQPTDSTNRFENAIFISEHNNIKHLPVVDSATYFIHNLDERGFYSQDLIDHDDVYNVLVYAEHYNWEKASSISENAWYSDSTKTLCILWATDLLPYEIDDLDPVLHDESRENVYFVGTKQGIKLDMFQASCMVNGKNFVHVGGLNGAAPAHGGRFLDASNTIDLIRDSYISFDIREGAADREGYVPCRVLKNISYGRWTGSNTPKIAKFLDGHVTVEENPFDLYGKLVEDSRNVTYDKIRSSMNFIRDKHTYINRVNSMFSIL